MPHEHIAQAENYIPRHAEEKVRTSLRDTRVVALVGPRQSGKTTLARRFANENRPFVTLDDEQFRSFAANDPTGFIRLHQAAVIDEIQRAPDLLLAVKKAVDDDQSPGRFLVTGSVDLFSGLVSPDSLAGRVETIELLPFSQAEIGRKNAPTFLDRAFTASFASFERLGECRNLIDRVISGGYPEVLTRKVPARRATWLLNYVAALTRRDLTGVSKLSRADNMTRLVNRAAVASGQLLNLSEVGSQLRIDGKTADRWLKLLEHMFLFRRVPAWHRNELKRLIRTPKLHFLDSGLLAAVRRIDKETVLRDRQAFGTLLECFVHAEIEKAIALSSEPIHLSHYRDKDKVEVDFVLENLSGEVVAIEVKASATIRPDDFKGLKRLRQAADENFACGILLHDGDRIDRVNDKLFAMPVKMLWEG